LQAGHTDRALGLLRAHEELMANPGVARPISSPLFVPAMLELTVSGPAAARTALDRARQQAEERQTPYVDPFLGFTSGGIAFAAGDWDDAAAELDSALERAQETGTGWISVAVGFRSYIDADHGATGAARARLESFRHRGLPLLFGQDRPGWAELAVLEAEGATRAASTLARTLWSAARAHPGQWASDLAPDVTRVALTGMDRLLAGQLRDEVPALCSPAVTRLVHSTLTADCDAIAAADLAAAGRRSAEAFAREELACAAAAAGDRDRAGGALAAYQRIGAVPDQQRTLARTRALGLRRGSRQAHRDADFGWGSLTATETRIAGLVRDGLTNREIGTRRFVSPRTVQTHVSHILQKTGLRSRVEIARFAGA
jgi:DNA-binding NarL/FixJ family response regulator